ncbi:bifunctional diguanylate cyclase/phosphodiesterase [Phycicoccus sp. BSK3Z-2]|uniref:Bifunctional diguanylate cyclase/phosphodiesterase n=1 Tax=Phycicoccus avicenniae TaxID=2828860 RepID=A0A941I159_9MICO|nr:bifunctional diguanylate cyclase/phosphodiesterase [Phycicoccus avicenniae]MBR7744832.1 bifunctional diguanylate cyclase/phosphodiesterase [Phycicoccus avicenniae]
MSSLRAAVLVLGVLWAAFPLTPVGDVRDGYYDVLAAMCIAVAVVAARRLPPPVRCAWMLVVLGFAGWVAGELVSTVEQRVLGLDLFPAPSDAFYLGAYGLLAAGLLRLVRGRHTRQDLTPVLDATIVAVGFGIVVGTFLVGPIAEDAGTSALERVVASAYPVGDVLLIGLLVRLWASVGSRSPAFRLLLVAVVATTAADVTWNVLALTDPLADDPAWLDMLWLLAYVAAAAAVCSRSATSIGVGTVQTEAAASPHRRLVALGAGLVLPAGALAFSGLLELDVPWRLVSVGSVVVSVLVVVRMALLLRTVEEQAVQLAALARSDGLTGAPNRRTWDHELGRAFQAAEESGGPLAIGLVDLDHFKRYNDEHGHQAGDLLLREAVAAWSDLLRPGELLARYGGEEFGLLMPGSTPEQAAQRLQVMQRLTPRGQRFSAGVAAWTPSAEPAAVVEQADRALYSAKHAGRGRTRIANVTHDAPETPAVQVALQPIVDVASGAVVGHEALSRFVDGDPERVFAEAHRAGYGPVLEAAAVAEALAHRPAEGILSVNVSVGALVSEEMRCVLDADLTGVMVEITEQTDTDAWDEVAVVVASCRTRGAVVAVDDWGRGYSNVERIMRLRPEVVKLDRSLVADLSDPDRLSALRTLGEWARSMGARVCAEGVESADQWAALRAIGIELAQGYLFGRPALASDEGADGVVGGGRADTAVSPVGSL